MNVVGTQTLLAALSGRPDVPVVFGSSSSVYGGNKKIPFAEDDPVREAACGLLELLRLAQGGTEFKARDLRPKVHEDNGKATSLGDALLNGGPWNAKRAGNRLRHLANRWFDGVRLKKVGGGKNGIIYQIECRNGERPEPKVDDGGGAF